MDVGFTKHRKRGLELTLDDDSRDALRALLGQLADLVRPEPDASASEGDPLAAMVGIGTSTSKPADPALARLFPDAYEDSIAAGDFRRYTEVSLRGRKLANATTALDTLDRDAPVALDAAEATCWLGALNDLRLVIGTRLDVQEDDDQDEWMKSEDAGSYLLYQWLTWLQGDLLHALEK